MPPDEELMDTHGNGIVELGGVVLGWALQHGQHKSLKVSRYLRLYIMSQILKKKFKKEHFASVCNIIHFQFL